MTTPVAAVQALVIQLGKIDAALSRCLAERKKAEKEVETKRAALTKATSDTTARERAFNDRKVRYHRDESEIRDEQDKLVQRRKALSTLNNYKVQQAGEREIESNARALTLREDTLLAGLQEVEDLEKLLEKSVATRDKLAGELKTAEADAKGLFETLARREADYKVERAAIAAQIDPVNLKMYEKIKARFPSDLVVEVKNGSCTGCFMSVGPQTVVQILKGEKLVQCPGCGRLVYLAAAEAEAVGSKP